MARSGNYNKITLSNALFKNKDAELWRKKSMEVESLGLVSLQKRWYYPGKLKRLTPALRTTH